MADIEFDDDDDFGASARGAVLQRITNWAAAVISVALVLGLGVWSWTLAVRDVRDVPVVRALEGPMRVAPADPGGRQAEHQGLSVNRIAAEGVAAPPPERLVLAPAPTDLAAEDRPVATPPPPAPARAAGDDGRRRDVVLASLRLDAPDAEADTEPAAAPVDQPIVDREAQIEALAAERPTTSAVDLALLEALADDPGILRSPRPRGRPGSDGAPLPVRTAAEPQGEPAAEIDPDSLARGTRLVQLGAFDSADEAVAEWDRLNARFGAYMDSRQRVVQAAESGGRAFFRLRAHGFEDEGDARRFCAALLAEQANCIPVMIR